MSNNPFRQSANGTYVDWSNGTSTVNGVERQNGSDQETLNYQRSNGTDNGRETELSMSPSAKNDFPEVNSRAHLSSAAPEVWRPSNGLSTLPETVNHAHLLDQSIPEAVSGSNSGSTTGEGSYSDSLPEGVSSLQIQDRPSRQEVTVKSQHAHVPSFSHIRKESLPVSRPVYVRAPSTHISEVEAPPMTATDAKAEAIRRLAKAERGPKPLKRRGSNESLSSLISYSIRRPSVSAKANSGHSLEDLATVLEDAAQEGNLPLVEAIMALGAHPVYRSTNRLKNRRHDALNKATAAGHVHVMDYLLRNGASYGFDEPLKKDPFQPIDYKLLDVAYSGYGQVAQYLITHHGANPFIEQWPRQYADAIRTVYRRVKPLKVPQRSVLDAIAKIGNPDLDMALLKTIMDDQRFDPTTITSRIYEDLPYEGDGTRMHQTTYHYSTLASFVKAGWVDAVELMLQKCSDPPAYQVSPKVTKEEGQIPSTHIQTSVYPANALSKDTWLYRRADALRILRLLIDHNFDLATPQKTADDSAPRTPLSRAILANAHEAVAAILSAHPDFVHDDISFRLLLREGSEEEYRAQPLAAAIIQGSMESAMVILQYGAKPTDPAFAYKNVMHFAAGHGGSTATAVLRELCVLAPEMVGEVLETAVVKGKPDAVHVLLYESGILDLSGLKLYDSILSVGVVERDEEFKRRYLQVIDLVFGADTRKTIPRPSKGVINEAITAGNVVGLEKLRMLGVLEEN